MTKKSKPERLPRLKRLKERRVFTELILGLDDLFRATFEGATIEDKKGKTKTFDARYVLEMRHVFQRVLGCHIKGETATAYEIAKHSGLSRETVRRILEDLVHIGWLDRNGSHFWISEATAKLPVMPRSAYDKATRLVIAAAKDLQSKKKK
jgi:hypothetical protein